VVDAQEAARRQQTLMLISSFSINDKAASFERLPQLPAAAAARLQPAAATATT